MKRSTLTLTVFLLATLILVLCYLPFSACLCRQLTVEPQTRPIDDALRALINLEKQHGILLYCRQPCPHGEVLHLMISPDEGTYRGWKTASSDT